MAVVVETTIGDFTVDLYTEERPQSKYTVHVFMIRRSFLQHICTSLKIKYDVYEMTYLTSKFKK